ncbi:MULTISPECIES: thiolase family protein [unclassified Acidovorax]|uniref:thiolase family protein n=1 Tax=unclassified Acidovorax TaxID=2684926 RepID=UPI000C1908BE|nr:MULTISPECIES: thiolase family protein [unclassified Acidovorax]PIF19396.1 acetyl-CoA acetyltransferase [Acidovorax sp. 59]PKW01576.1 acetyl-CoA acetyltransferase [Acidovorax sp. 30]
MTRRVALIGASAIPNGRHQTADDEELQVLENEIMTRLVAEAVQDAGISKEDIQSLVFTLPRPYTRQKYFHTFLVGQLRLACRGSVMEVMGNGMTAALAFDKACDEILLGRSDVALALGINMESAVSAAEHMMSSMRTTGDVDFHTSAGFTPIAWYAMDAMRYMHETGATREQLASVAVKNRHHASLNPLAQYRKPITLEEVLAQRPIVEPLGLYDVPPRGDGAACLVLASEEVAKSLGKPYVLVRGRGFYHDGSHQINDVPNDMIGFEAAARASRDAYAQAGITAADLDVVELYAPCTIVEVLVSEAIGLVPRGHGAHAAFEGETRLGGRIPVSTSGGLTSRGHPAYVTSLYNYVELADQLRGRAGERQVKNARFGLSTGELGNYNAALVHVLEAMA